LKGRPFAVVLAASFLTFLGAPESGAQTIRVMTFNAWGGGSNDGTGPAQTLAAIRAADADLVGLQEVRAEGSQCSAEDCPAEGPSFASVAARVLGYHLVEQSGDADLVWAQAILSRYPPVATSSNGVGASFDIADRRVAIFNVHFTDYPYQPYQAVGIPYDEALFLSTPAELIQAAVGARGDALGLLRTELDFAADAGLILVTGDFNEPSHRDWSEAAARAGRHPLAVEYPTILALEELGFVDAYRAVHGNEMTHPGYTWTPTRPLDDSAEHHDRIDFVLLRSAGAGARVTGAWVVGESAEQADIVVQPWPSDHRAVVAEITLGEKGGVIRSRE